MSSLRLHSTTKLIAALILTGLGLIVFIAMMLTIQIQKSRQPLAPTAPTSRPGADGGLGNCSLGFDITAPVSPSPTPRPVCGNNRQESGEECDDGNLADSDGCNRSCQTEVPAWWQLAGGQLYVKNDTINSDIPRLLCQRSSSCSPYLLRSDLLSPFNIQTAGVPQAGGARFNLGGYTTQRSPQAVAVDTTHSEWTGREHYAGLLQRFDTTKMTILAETLSRFPEGVAQGNAGDIKDVAVSFRDGNLTIAPDSTWKNISGKHVIFVSGNLTLIGTGHPLISVQSGGFLAFVVKGNITFEKTVGTTNSGDNTPTISGVYIADGQIVVSGASRSEYRRFTAEGVYVGWSGVKLGHNSVSYNNRGSASQLFVYRPDYLINAPGQFKMPFSRWQEVD